MFVTTNVIPSELKVYNFTLTGSNSDSNVKVYLNGQLYQEYTIDFQNKTASPTYHEYKIATTAPETVEETTVEETETETETMTEYSVTEITSTEEVTIPTEVTEPPTTESLPAEIPEQPDEIN